MAHLFALRHKTKDAMANPKTTRGKGLKIEAVEIEWGTLGDSPVKYTFDTEAEMEAFLKGANEACGWSSFDVVETRRPSEDALESPAEWTHLKTGKVYTIHAMDVINATNDRDGQVMVLYLNSSGMMFVRELEEFKEKFEPKA